MTDTATDAGISMTRVFDAPRELVFAAWTEPARFAYWFGGAGTEVPTSSVEMDLRPGGQWKATMLLENDNRNRRESSDQYRVGEESSCAHLPCVHAR